MNFFFLPSILCGIIFISITTLTSTLLKKDQSALKLMISRRIIGGSKVNDSTLYPFMVIILQNDEKFCSGTIVDRFTILTAAHCVVTSSGMLYSNISITAGILDIEDYSSVDYDDVKEHEDLVFYISPHHIFDDDHSYESTIYDVAIIKTRRPFIFKANVQPVKMSFTKVKHYIGAIESVWIVGYGETECGSVTDDISLHHAQLDTDVTRGGNCHGRLCSKYNKKIVCAANGDSGGPLLIKDSKKFEQWGIIATGFSGFSTQGYTAFADLNRNEEFIRRFSRDNRPFCGEIDKFPSPTPINVLVGNAKRVFPWLLSLKNRIGKCHVIYIGNNTLLMLSECFESVANKFLKINHFKVLSEWQADYWLDVNNSQFLQRKVNRKYMTVTLTHTNLENVFYIRPICQDIEVIISRNTEAVTVTGTANNKLIITEVRITDFLQDKDIICTEMVNQTESAFLNVQPHQLGSPLFYQSPIGKFYLVGMYLNQRKLSKNCSHPFIRYLKSETP